jgi:hypothetical protein
MGNASPLRRAIPLNSGMTLRARSRVQGGGARNGGRGMSERQINAVGLCIMLSLMMLVITESPPRAGFPFLD